MTMRLCECGTIVNTDNIDFNGKCPKCGRKIK
jgi:DNA-directed RNA polymerase subunit RPC12/RpoP